MTTLNHTVTAPILNIETASAYIVAQHDQDAAPCNVVEAHEHEVDGVPTVEVTFWFNGWKHTADVWIEGDKLYGGW